MICCSRGDTRNSPFRASRSGNGPSVTRFPSAAADGALFAQFFEDHETPTNRTAWAPLNLARYLLERKQQLDPDWRTHAGILIEFVRRHFTHVEFGVTVCHEQDEDPEAWGGVNSTYGAVLALYAQAVGLGELGRPKLVRLWTSRCIRSMSRAARAICARSPSPAVGRRTRTPTSFTIMWTPCAPFPSGGGEPRACRPPVFGMRLAQFHGMNPTIQAVIAPAIKNEPAQSMPTPANSDNGRAAAQDFAGALRAAAGKVTRKTGQSRAPKPDTGGAALPENGNRSPPLTPPSPPMAAAPSAPVAISAPMPASPAVVQSPTMPASPAVVQSPRMAASPAVVQSPTVAASPPVVASPPVTVPPPGTTSLPSAATVSGLIQAAAEASDVANAGAGRGAPDDALSGAAGAQTHGPSATDEIDGAGQEPGTASPAAARTVGEAASTAAVRGAAAETAASTGAADASRIAAGISQAALAANRLPAARVTDSAPHTTAPPVAPNESAAPSASTQSTEVAALELALAEGSDATGAAATAVQQAGSAAAPVATASALDAAQGPILQSIAGAADAPAAVPQVAASTLADAGDGGAHARGGAGDGGTGGSSGGNSGGNSSAAAQQLSAESVVCGIDRHESRRHAAGRRRGRQCGFPAGSCRSRLLHGRQQSEQRKIAGQSAAARADRVADRRARRSCSNMDEYAQRRDSRGARVESAQTSRHARRPGIRSGERRHFAALVPGTIGVPGALRMGALGAARRCVRLAAAGFGAPDFERSGGRLRLA